ncbi:hypothetical protein J2755_001036 [Methanohalophilus levihalophilus]|uniref:hypothetical protein n=1 Tax=Methanohalophilus levihalophilus TaxID=1431282 RepID=UPI001AE32E13|nr:hypothetical protein [Methanohalophilus levihalophilus]MBP2030102.1 hypothetical protein [Methanohalophilus levihalophilus]
MKVKKNEQEEAGLPTVFGKDVREFLRFYKGGLLFVALLGIYLGIQGLYLIIIDKNFIPGICLFLAALLISPPPIGISNMVAQHLRIELTMGIKLGFSALLLVIAVLTL